MKKIYLIILIVISLTTIGFAQEVTDNQSAQEVPTTATQTPVAPAEPTPSTTPATPTATPVEPAPATTTPTQTPATADKSYDIYVEDPSVDKFTLPNGNIVYVMGYANIGFPLAGNSDFTKMPEAGGNISVGAIFKKYIGLDLNFGYITNDYFDDDDYYYRNIWSNNRNQYKDSVELYSIKLFLTGNLPIDFGNTRIMPYIGVGGAVTFSLFHWHEVSVVNPIFTMRNESFDASIGPAAKIGVKYFYKNLILEANVEYVYAFHNSVKRSNISYIGLNAGIGFAF